MVAASDIAPVAVETEMQFLDPTEEAPINYFGVEPPAGRPARFPRVTVNLKVGNARSRRERPEIEVDGFVLREDAAGLPEDFHDEDAVRRVYYPALARLIREETGAAEALVFDHTYRASQGHDRYALGIDEVVREVHNDYTAASGPARVREMTMRYRPDLDIDRRMRGRYAIYNVWRSIGGVVKQMPLGVCDMRSIEPGDVVPAELWWPERKGYVSVARYNKGQRWHYYPDMTGAEALIFKCFDSKPVRPPGHTLHTAFPLPGVTEATPARKSIEARIIAFF